MKNRGIVFTMSALFILTLGYAAFAAEYPSKPVTLICPLAAGGTHDVVARGFAAVAERHFGQPVVVVNKPGGSGLVGGKALADAAPDGYTLGIDSSGQVTNTEYELARGRKPPYMPEVDFTTIGSLMKNPTLVLVPYNSPWQSIADMVRDCKAKPGFYAYSSAAMYGGVHFAAAMLTRALGIKVRNVPYDGGGQALTAAVGGHVHFVTQYPQTASSLVRGKKLRAIGVQSEKRLKYFPDVPTVREQGFEGAEYEEWLGIAAPKKLPPPIAAKLIDLVKKTISDQAYLKLADSQDTEVFYMNPEELSKFRKQERERVGKLLRQMLADEKKK